jgi:hypothetical protein
MISGPMPAGSPRLIARGSVGGPGVREVGAPEARGEDEMDNLFFENIEQQIRTIGNHSIQLHGVQASHFFGVIDRPGHHFKT